MFFTVLYMELKKSDKIAIVGFSKDKNKYGNKIFYFLKNRGFNVYPVNPKLDEVDGIKIYHSLKDLPEKVDIVNLVVPPKVTEKVVKEVKEAGLENVWMQPGSESDLAIKFCKENNIEVLYNSCIMVAAERL